MSNAQVNLVEVTLIAYIILDDETAQKSAKICLDTICFYYNDPSESFPTLKNILIPAGTYQGTFEYSHNIDLTNQIDPNTGAVLICATCSVTGQVVVPREKDGVPSNPIISYYPLGIDVKNEFSATFTVTIPDFETVTEPTCMEGYVLVDGSCVLQTSPTIPPTPSPEPTPTQEPSPSVFDFVLDQLTFTMVWTQAPHPQTGELPTSYRVYWTPDTILDLSNPNIKFLGTTSGGNSGTFTQTIGDSGLHCFAVVAIWSNFNNIQSNTKCVNVVAPSPTPPTPTDPTPSPTCPEGFVLINDLCVFDISATEKRFTSIESSITSLQSQVNNLANSLAQLWEQFITFIGL